MKFEIASLVATVLVAILFSAAFLDAADGERIVCPQIKSTDSSMHLESSDPNKKDFLEVSGLGFSPSLVGPSGQPLIYAVNDGGGGRRIGIFDSGSGARLKSLRMPRSSQLNIDYEGLTVGSCGVDDGACIYIADVGDNQARDANGTRSDREAYPVYKIREPNLDDFEDNDILPESDVMTLWFNYFHSTSPTRYADCETVFLDNVGWGEGGAIGDFYIVTKWEDYGSTIPANTLNRLFKIPAEVWTQAKEDANYTYSPEAVGDYSKGKDSNALMGYMWTRGEMTTDGTLITLGDYYDQYIFLRCPGTSVAEAITAEGTQSCQTWPIEYWDSQFETIAWAPDGRRTLEISECYGTSCNPDPPMVWTTMDYTYDPGTSVACPAAAATTEMPSGSPSSQLPLSQSPTSPTEVAPTTDPAQSWQAPPITADPSSIPGGDTFDPVQPITSGTAILLSDSFIFLFGCFVAGLMA